jgi:endonuclease G, mitochondrial
MLLTEGLIASSVERAKKLKLRQQVAALPRDGARPASQAAQRRIWRQMAAQTGSSAEATLALERIIAGNDLVGISYLTQGLLAGRAVGRIHLRDSTGRLAGYGTGFLVGPNLVMTNNHVIGSDVAGGRSIVEFDYEYDALGRDRPTSIFDLDPEYCFITNRDLDFTLIGVADSSGNSSRSLSEFGWLRLDGTPGKTLEGEYLTIIQHPNGERKQLCVRENKVLKYADNRTVWYQTDTVAGSSGSPAFNGRWEVVALHHSGVPATDKQGRWLTIDGKVFQQGMDESRIKWIANEGIRISRIVEHLRVNFGDLRPVQALLEAKPPVSIGDTEDRPGRPEIADQGGTSISLKWGNSELRLNGPITLISGNGNGFGNGHGGEARPRSNGARPNGDGNGHDNGFEAVIINQKNYDERPGYDPKFLGGGLTVPLPRLTGENLAAALKDKKGRGAKPLELKYYNYSVLMNARRRLAFVAAVNIDGALRRSTGKREGDRWYFDVRKKGIEESQLGDDFYKGRMVEEARKTPFDRGHLVRRLDSTWGETKALAKRNGDDTFHFTNCTPQHFIFNQDATRVLWGGIEDYVLSRIENQRQRACVLNGPVFRDDDEKYERTGIRIPRQYWKLVAFVQDGELAATAFLLSQESLLSEEEALRPMDEDRAESYQVTIAHLSRITGLDFGPLRAADTKRTTNEAVGRQPLQALSEIEF